VLAAYRRDAARPHRQPDGENRVEVANCTVDDAPGDAEPPCPASRERTHDGRAREAAAVEDGDVARLADPIKVALSEAGALATCHECADAAAFGPVANRDRRAAQAARRERSQRRGANASADSEPVERIGRRRAEIAQREEACDDGRVGPRQLDAGDPLLLDETEEAAAHRSELALLRHLVP